MFTYVAAPAAGKMPRTAHRLVAAAVIGAMSSAAFGSIMGFASGSADANDGLPASSESLVSTEPLIMLFADASDSVGGRGLGLTNLDFLGGTMSGRAHSCAGPAVPYIDNCFGSSSIQIDEQMQASGPVGSTVSVSICWSITSNAYGDTREPSLTLAANARNTFNFKLGPEPSISGLHEARIQSPGDIVTLGIFADQSGIETVTAEGVITFDIPANLFFDFDFNMHISTNARSRSGVGLFPEINASSGYAMTFGLMSITPGARLLWRGQEWTGYCGDSAPFVPPNPVPTPSTIIAMCLAGAATTQRRRR